MMAEELPIIPASPASAPSQQQVADVASKLFAGRPDSAGTVGVALNFGGNPILEKLTADHLTKSIELASVKSAQDFELKKLELDQKKTDEQFKNERAKSDRHFEIFAL